MRTLAAVLLAAAPLAPMQAAAATVQAPPAATAADGQHVVVHGDRRVCRQVRRTASRMGQGRICRTASEWAGTHSVRADGSYDDIGDAYIKGMGTFERCPYDNGGAVQTTLGPR